MRCHRFLLFLALVAAGCGRAPEFASVDGTVTRDGQPLAGVTVRFLPDPEKDTVGPESNATTDDKGQYRLRALTKEGKDGAIVGWHRILVEDPTEDRPPQGQPSRKPSRVPPRYASPAKTPFRQEIRPGSQSIPLSIDRS